ncbi:MAG TPA: maleylpyruvate isomerase N-terminal domain-containing protein [Acidimicrobiales bacterium]|nr:maleylpyruvate isomerase N-terminal domain-containing protein [Acidimicrobiales bacterium]
MNFTERIDALEAQSLLIVAALESGDPTAMVPTCPEFTLDRLAFHVGEFSGFWTHVVCEGTGRPKTPFPPDAEPGPARSRWVDALTTNLVVELRSAEPDTPCWTWNDDDQSAGFIANRTCHELTIHRVDLELAASGRAGPVPTDVAIDGIEEVFLLVGEYGIDGERGTPGSGETLCLDASDHDAAWHIRLDPEAVSVTRGAAAADLTITATVSDLEMLLYQRPTAGKIDWIGDRGVLDVFHGEFTFS